MLHQISLLASISISIFYHKIIFFSIVSPHFLKFLLFFFPKTAQKQQTLRPARRHKTQLPAPASPSYSPKPASPTAPIPPEYPLHKNSCQKNGPFLPQRAENRTAEGSRSNGRPEQNARIFHWDHAAVDQGCRSQHSRSKQYSHNNKPLCRSTQQFRRI